MTFRGYRHSEETKKKIGDANRGNRHSDRVKQIISETNYGEKHGRYMGDKAGYNSKHYWVKRRKPKPDLCEICCLKKRLVLANKSGKYQRDLDDWIWLCYKCHVKYDRDMFHNNKWGGGRR